MKDRDSSTTVQVDEQEEETKPRMDERMKNGRNGRKMGERYDINQLYKWMTRRRTTSQIWMKGMGGR